MKKYKVLILVVLPAIMTIVYLSFSETEVSNERVASPNLNSRIVGIGDYLKFENLKSIPKSGFVTTCQVIIPGSENQAKGNASAVFCSVSLQDGNLAIGSRVIQEEISISKNLSTKKRNLTILSRIGVCKDSSVTCRFHFSF
jgi:hypothetical protein